MTTAAQAVSTAIITTLRASAPVVALVGSKIFETIPIGDTPPVIAINSIYSAPWDTSDTAGETLDVQISVFARGQSARIDALTIGGAIKKAIHRQVFAIAGHSLVWCQFTGSIVQRSDGPPHNGEAHGIFRFNVVVQEA